MKINNINIFLLCVALCGFASASKPDEPEPKTFVEALFTYAKLVNCTPAQMSQLTPDWVADLIRYCAKHKVPVDLENPTVKGWARFSFESQGSGFTIDEELIKVKDQIQGVFTTDRPDFTYLNLSVTDPRAISMQNGKKCVQGYRVIQNGGVLDYIVPHFVEVIVDPQPQQPAPGAAASSSSQPAAAALSFKDILEKQRKFYQRKTTEEMTPQEVAVCIHYSIKRGIRIGSFEKNKDCYLQRESGASAIVGGVFEDFPEATCKNLSVLDLSTEREDPLTGKSFAKGYYVIRNGFLVPEIDPKIQDIEMIRKIRTRPQAAASSSSQPAPQPAAAAAAQKQTIIDFSVCIPTKDSKGRVGIALSVKGGRTALSKFLRDAITDNLNASPGVAFGFGFENNGSFEEFKVQAEFNDIKGKLVFAELSVEDFLNKGRSVSGRGKYKTVRLVHTDKDTKQVAVSDIIIGGTVRTDGLAFHA